MTISECYSAMQEPYKTQAFINRVKFRFTQTPDNIEFQKVSNCLMETFDWQDTETIGQGFNYWDNYYNTLINMGL